MADLCEGGNEPSGSLKAICKRDNIKEYATGAKWQLEQYGMKFKVCHGSLYAVMWLADEPREFNLPTLPQRRITYEPEKLPSKYGVHSEDQATKGDSEGVGFGPVLWIEFGVAQWSERLVRRTKDPGSVPGAGANFSPQILIVNIFCLQENVTDRNFRSHAIGGGGGGGGSGGGSSGGGAGVGGDSSGDMVMKKQSLIMELIILINHGN
ncbi:hypothetical protein ANN_07370 [Periplaneta americana]|uniref:Uncharacterized protein n=1 Tax=Periplaneta americana TaxID=6978 RepID=A0ABQ8SZY7_PERAM|nr:hypothetical protein ANN_07370 [Periplaneta americana]